MNDRMGRPQVEKFRQLLEATAELAERRKVLSKPYDSKDLPLFSRLPLMKQMEISAYLECYLEIVSQPVTCVQAVKNLYSRKSWRMPSDLESLLKDDMDIEFYNFDNQQIFRNIEFFRLSERSIEEICTLPWYELYERENRITQYMLELTRMLSTGEISGCMSYLLNPHEVRDTNTRLKAGTEMGPLFVGPILEGDGSVVGYFSTFRSPRS